MVSYQREKVVFKTPAQENNAPIVNASSFKNLAKHEKILPKNAYVQGSSHTLFLLTNPVRYKCSCCEKKNIISDEVAVNTKKHTLQCKNCYARSVKPRTFAPLKLHPCPVYVKLLQGASAAYCRKDIYSRIERSKSQNVHLSSIGVCDIPVQAFYPSAGRSVVDPKFDQILSLKYSAGVEDDNYIQQMETVYDVEKEVPKDAQALHSYLKVSR